MFFLLMILFTKVGMHDLLPVNASECLMFRFFFLFSTLTLKLTVIQDFSNFS